MITSSLCLFTKNLQYVILTTHVSYFVSSIKHTMSMVLACDLVIVSALIVTEFICQLIQLTQLNQKLACSLLKCQTHGPSAPERYNETHMILLIK